MNRCGFLIWILIASGCYVLKKNSTNSANVFQETTIHAIVKTQENPSLRLKTKTIVYKDTIISKVYPPIGPRLGEAIITNEKIYIDQLFKNKKDSLNAFSIDPSFSIKKLLAYLMPSQINQDTLTYQVNDLKTVFTDYESIGNVFLPRKIIFSRNISEFNYLGSGVLEIEYKSVLQGP